MFNLPITGDSSQAFNIVLDGRVYQLAIDWNSRHSFWTLCIQTSEGVDLVRGTKIVQLDLLSGHTSELLPDGIITLDVVGTFGRDSFTDGTARLIYVTEAEKNALI